MLRCRRWRTTLERKYATSAQFHAAQAFRTAAGLHRLFIHPGAALRGPIPVFNASLADCVRCLVDSDLNLSAAEFRPPQMDNHVSVAVPEFLLRRRVVGRQ